MKLIDCCMFNGDEIVKMRLEYYKDFFDEFYFTESWYTFTGKRKDFLYCEKYAEWFAPYKEKVKFVILNDFHSLNPWEQESHQRNAAVPQILSNHDDAIVFFSDCDEFYDINTLPPLEKMIEITKEKKKVVHVEMKLYQCRFTNFQPMTWTNAYFLHTSLLRTIHNIHELRVFKNQRNVPIPADCIKSGWHFSCFMSVDDLIRKLESFSHQELNTPKYKDKANIENLIQSTKDIFMRKNIKVEYIDFNNSFHGYPEVFRKYHEKLTSDGHL